jgi:hypothetical protein
MLALSNCTAAEIKAAPEAGASCVDEAFAPMPLVAGKEGETGIAEGPLFTLLQFDPSKRNALLVNIFADGNPGKLSSGHRAVAEQVAPLMSPLSQFYAARASGAPVSATAAAAQMLNAQIPNNYSPTAYLVSALGPAETRAMDYVVTVGFVNATGFKKAKALAKNPVP